MSPDPREGGPWYVPAGNQTGHIVQDGEPLCGTRLSLLAAHKAVDPDDVALTGKKGQCSKCVRLHNE